MSRWGSLSNGRVRASQTRFALSEGSQYHSTLRFNSNSRLRLAYVRYQSLSHDAGSLSL